jgi:hypothetical protein
MNIISNPKEHEAMLRPTKRWVIGIGVVLVTGLVAVCFWVWLRL